MIQQKEACRKHPCVLPKKVAFLVWVPNFALIGWWGLPVYFLHASCKLPACFLHASLPASCVLPTCFLHASCMLPECFLLYCCYMLQYTKITTSKLNWTETHTILPTFLGSTQEAHMGASCVLPSILLLHITVIYQNHHFKAKLDWNSHYLVYFFRKHAGSTHGCYLRASFCCIINGSCCIFYDLM